MVMRIGQKPAKRLRVGSRPGTKAVLPSADELRHGLDEIGQVAAKQKARGFVKRGKGGRFVKRAAKRRTRRK